MNARTLNPLIPNPLGLSFVHSKTFQPKMARECMGRAFLGESCLFQEPGGCS
jgi:hypothetical protein